MSAPRQRALIIAAAATALVLVLGLVLLREDSRPGRDPAGPADAPTTPDGPPRDVPLQPGQDLPPGQEHHGHAHPPEDPPDAGPAGGPAPAPEPDAVALRGRVQGPEGQPVGEATVSAGQLRPGAQGWTLTRSDAAGRFALSRRELPSSRLLEVAAPGWATRLVSLEEGAAGELVVVLLPRRALRGRVLAAEDDRPLEEAEVSAESASWRGWARTDAAGRFELSDVPQGEELNLFVRAAGRVAVVASEPAQGELLVRLGRGVAVRGVVVDPAGQPVEAAVWIVPAAQLVSPHVQRSDASGRFEVWGVAEGDEVLALAETREAASPLLAEWRPAAGELRIELRARGTLTLRNPPAGELALRAVDCPAPLPGAERALGRAGERRELRVERLAAGRWQLEVDGTPRGDPIDLAPGASLEVDGGVLGAGAGASQAPPLEPGPCEVVVRVTDELGRVLVGAEVGVSSQGRQRTRQTGADGVARVAELGVAPLSVSAFLPGRVLVAPAYVEPTPGIPSEVTLVLSAPTALSGRVVPPQVAELRAVLPDGSPVAHGRSGEDGVFRLGGLPRVKLRLEVEAGSSLPAALEVDPTVAQELTVRLEPDPGHGVPPAEPR